MSDYKPHVVIDDHKNIILPEELKNHMVQFDHNVKTITFDCPRYSDGRDLSTMRIYVNYFRKSGEKDSDVCQNIKVDSKDTNLIHFEWVPKRSATLEAGVLAFLICAEKEDAEGNQENAWHTKLCKDLKIAEGIDCLKAVIEKYPTIITYLLTRMEDVESIATPEAMQTYVNQYLLENPPSGMTVEERTLLEENIALTSRLSGENAELKEDLSNKITKFYASNQGEAHITDSDNGKIQDMMIYGKSSQDGTPSPENPVEIKSVVNPTIKLLGSNILKIADGEYQEGGLTVTVSNGVVKLKGTANRHLEIRLTADGEFFLKEGTKIIFSPNNVKGIENQNGCYLDFSNNITVGFSIMSNNINIPYIIKERDTKYPFDLFIRCYADKTYDETWMPQVSIGETITPFKPYTEQIITLPITLNAMPVSSGGNVTIDGQQYISDYADAERWKIVQMVQREKLMNIANVSITNAEYDEYVFDYADSTKFRNNIVGITNIANFDDISGSNNNMQRGVFAVTRCQIYLRVSKMALPQTIEDMKKWLNNNDLYCILPLISPIEIDLHPEENTAFKALATYYPTTNISVNSEQLDGYTVFNYPISIQNGWNYVKQQLNDNRDYIYDMDLQSAEAYVNSEYAVALTELEA